MGGKCLLRRLKGIGAILIILGIIGIIISGYSLALGVASDARKAQEDVSSILKRHEISTRSMGETVQEAAPSFEQMGISIREAGVLMSLVPLVRAGDPLIDAGERMYRVGVELNATGADLIDTADDMKSLSQNLKTMSDEVIYMIYIALLTLLLVSVMVIVVGFGFCEIERERREVHQLYREIDEMKRMR